MSRVALKGSRIDEQIIRFIQQNPGANQSQILRAVKKHASDTYVRHRIGILEEQGKIRVIPARGELNIYPADPVPGAA